MNRATLEQKVHLRWENADMFHQRCVGTLPLRTTLIVSADEVLNAETRGYVEKTVRSDFADEVLGDLEERNNRLTAAVKKWAYRAQAGSMSRQIEPDQWGDELKEDLR